jgi:hypothetical protein
MGKIRNPLRFTKHFNVPESVLDKLGVLNPTLNADTKLFIDPLLLASSSHKIIRVNARKTYESHFREVIRLLKANKNQGDVAWRAARRLMCFPEIPYTCLGYSAQTVSGSGSGTETTDQIMQTAKEIVELGIDDPDLFVSLGVFEEGMGPDRISDMTTNVILGDLVSFNVNILEKIDCPKHPFNIPLLNGEVLSASLPINPFFRKKTPVLLPPTDILRALPIAKDWGDISSVASHNSSLRQRVNRDLGHIWNRKTLKDKADFKDRVMSSKTAFETFLEMLHGAKATAYDLAGDPVGEIVWRRIAETIATEAPFQFKTQVQPTLNSVCSVVEEIIAQFKFLIEERRLSEELYHKGSPRIEKAAQRLFFAIAYAYCKANNVDITPEADTGNGPVDFKMSNGFAGRALVEIKLSTNSKLDAGYTNQLEKYKDAEEATKGYYIVINVGFLKKKMDRLKTIAEDRKRNNKPVSPIILIDGLRRKSASKL